MKNMYDNTEKKFVALLLGMMLFGPVILGSLALAQPTAFDVRNGSTIVDYYIQISPPGEVGNAHITWTFTGEAAKCLRNALILRYDNRTIGTKKGVLEKSEVEDFFSRDSFPAFFTARNLKLAGLTVTKFALKNADVLSDTSGLVGSVLNSTQSITVDANLEFKSVSPDEGEISLSNTSVPNIFYDAMNINYRAEYNLQCRILLVGFNSYSSPKLQSGNFMLVRTPAGEYLSYGAIFKGLSSDMVVHSGFDFVENPQILFIVTIIFMWFTCWAPRYWQATYSRAKKIIWLHLPPYLLTIVMFVFYFFPTLIGFIGGLVLWFLGIIFFVLFFTVSWQLYKRAGARVMRAPPPPIYFRPRPVPPAPAPAPRPKPEPVSIIEDVFLVYKDGNLLAHNTRRLKPDVDEQILTAMFTAIQNFAKDSFRGVGKGDWELNKLEFGPNKIQIEHGKYVALAVVYTGAELEGGTPLMKQIIEQVETKYGDVLADWDGRMEKVAGMKDIIKAMFWFKPEKKPAEKIAAVPPPPPPVIPPGSQPLARCNICLGMIYAGYPALKCRCGNMYHGSCATQIGNCPACGTKLYASRNHKFSARVP